MTRDEYIALGREVVKDGRLKALQRRVQFSSTYMAELLHTNSITYQSWLNRKDDVNLWKRSAERIGRFYHQASTTLELLHEDIREFLPMHYVAPRLGLPQEELLRRWREGEFEALDLGVLGLWVEKKLISTTLVRR